MSKKVNKDLEITSVCCTLYLCTKIISYSIFLLSIKRLLTGVFHFKTSRLGFSFLSVENFEIIQFRFFQSDFHLSSYRLTVEIRLFQSRANQAFHQETKLCKIRCSNSSSSQTICQHLHQCQISKYNLAQCLDQVIPQEYVRI